MKSVLLGVLISVFLFGGTCFGDRTIRDKYGGNVGSITRDGNTDTFRNRWGGNEGTRTYNNGTTDYRDRYGSFDYSVENDDRED